jgi:myo-inositol-1(or 4)-monophosphatase
MSKEIVQKSLEIFDPLLREIGGQLKKKFANSDFQVSEKAKQELVTSADTLSENYILSAIKENFPDHHILSEESGDVPNASKSPYLWVVDPLDGTTNFVYRNPFFAISISLFYEKEVILGMVYNPILDEMYIAKKGEGAWCNEKALKVSLMADVEKLKITYCYGASRDSRLNAIKLHSYFKEKSDIRQLGSSALELALVARGITDVFIVPGALRWDVAAGVLLVREAGGQVIDFEGKEWTYDSADMLAGNGQSEDLVLPIIQNLL